MIEQTLGSIPEKRAAEICDSCGHVGGIHYRGRGVCRAEKCNCQAFACEWRTSQMVPSSGFDPKAGIGYYGKSDE